MAKHGQTINLYLMDGDASGRYEAKLGNWNIVTYKIPYGMVDESDRLYQIHTAGVYFLFSDQNGRRLVYVGESEDLLKRLTQHTPDRDGYRWSEAIAFVSTDSSLDKGKIKYLENRLYNIINDAGAYQLLNRNEPRKSALSNADQDSMEALIDNVKLVVPVIGQDPFKQLTVEVQPTHDAEPEAKSANDNGLIYLRNDRKHIHATARYNDDGTVTVLKGSLIGPEVRDTLPQSVRTLRTDLTFNKQLLNFQLMSDVDFNSLSGAATFVYGYLVSGPRAWQREHDKQPVLPEPDAPQPRLVKNDDHQLLFIKSAKKQVDAQGYLNNDGTFTVMKGSRISPEVRMSLTKTLLNRRETLIERKLVVDYQLQKDIRFSSSSSAVKFVFGRSASGPSVWLTKDGRKLSQLDE
ncbi:GIY-YIG nuclease family protein [Lactobacillaceae bacterium Melli_B4]